MYEVKNEAAIRAAKSVSICLVTAKGRNCGNNKNNNSQHQILYQHAHTLHTNTEINLRFLSNDRQTHPYELKQE